MQPIYSVVLSELHRVALSLNPTSRFPTSRFPTCRFPTCRFALRRAEIFRPFGTTAQQI
ncbi:hypothetical protein Barb4_02946 [Bacteroidales bacterium Barb4]|nr:hypothetical protein Barb4_02946 [Bacteroidales bacterium Barb4]